MFLQLLCNKFIKKYVICTKQMHIAVGLSCSYYIMQYANTMQCKSTHEVPTNLAHNTDIKIWQFFSHIKFCLGLTDG